jgi:hypothetical protein
MNTRDLFIVVVKLFGLYSAVFTLFMFIPNWVSVLWDPIYEFDTTGALLYVFGFGVTIGLLILLITKAPAIVSFLGLDRGLDEDRIDIRDLRPYHVVALGCFVVGGLLFVDALPTFLTNLFFAFRSDIAGMEHKTRDNVDLVMTGLKVIAGYLLVVKHATIAGKLSEK